MNAERVIVLRGGRISGELVRAEINEEAILMQSMAS
jgi:ABC-type sugar transport system ATPase subunit